MKIDIDTSDVERVIADLEQMTPTVRRRAWVAVRVVSFEAEREVKLRMPVNSGRARASWGHSSLPALPDEGIWEENPGEGSITQGSRVEYIQYLNNGSSTQAPKGFIDAAHRRAERRLEDLINDIEASP